MWDLIRKLTPGFILELFRKFKKSRTRKSLLNKKKAGEVISKAQLKAELQEIGITDGDILMVHSAMSKIGFLENGPKTFVDALLETLSASGTLLMPSSPVDKLQLDYINQNNVFDVLNTPSKMGAISEYFRQLPDTYRSIHPTEPVCANGKKAKAIIADHISELTPYSKKSPWYKLMEAKGKILYVGVTLINSGTNLHVLEDLTEFKYPVYASGIFNVDVIDENGRKHEVKTKVHNPEFSNRRKCDELIPRFISDGVLKEVRLGNAQCLLLDAEAMLKSMLKGYEEMGITMYTPNGESIENYD